MHVLKGFRMKLIDILKDPMDDKLVPMVPEAAEEVKLILVTEPVCAPRLTLVHSSNTVSKPDAAREPRVAPKLALVTKHGFDAALKLSEEMVSQLHTKKK